MFASPGAGGVTLAVDEACASAGFFAGVALDEPPGAFATGGTTAGFGATAVPFADGGTSRICGSSCTPDDCV